MTIRDLQRYLGERKLIHKTSISNLQNTRVGIDGFFWLTKILQNEPFQVAMGGIPLTFINKIDRELTKYKNANITPVFIFNGITHKKVETKKYVKEDEIEQKRRSAWNAYERGQVTEAAALFLATATTIPSDFINYIFQHFSENNIEFFRAPYLSWAQLSYFAETEKPFIHAIYAADEQLMFNIPRMITDINFQEETFDYIDKKEILTNLNLTESQFLDSCILAGSFFTKLYPPVADISKKSHSFHYAQDMVRHFRSGYQVVQHYLATSEPKDKLLYQEYTNQFLLTKALISHHIILDSNCAAVPIAAAGLPKDFHDVTGTRLPNELYYLLSQGAISPTLISSLITGVIFETAPLADSQEYRNVITWLTPLRSLAINLLTTTLNEHYQKKVVTVVSWHSPDHVELERHLVKIFDSISWQFTDADIQKQLKQQKSQAVDFQFCLAWKPPASQNTQPKFTSADQLRAFVNLKAFDLLGYFSKRPNTQYEHTAYGRALQKAKIFPEQSMIVLELLKLQLLNNKPFTPVFKRYAASAKVPKKHKFEYELVLVLRVISLIPMKMKANQQWSPGAGVNHDLMTFNSIVKAVYRTLRQVYEMLFAGIFMQGNCSSELLPELPRLGLKLPFFQESNTATGIVARYLLETPVEELEVDAIAKKFNSCADAIADFRDKAVPFWNQVLAMVRALYTGKSSADSKNGPIILEQFESADKFLQDRLGQISAFLMSANSNK